MSGVRDLYPVVVGGFPYELQHVRLLYPVEVVVWESLDGSVLLWWILGGLFGDRDPVGVWSGLVRVVDEWFVVVGYEWLLQGVEFVVFWVLGVVCLRLSCGIDLGIFRKGLRVFEDARAARWLGWWLVPGW